MINNPQDHLDGVGVRFRSDRDWKSLFNEAGLRCIAETEMVVDEVPLKHKAPLLIGRTFNSEQENELL